MENKIPRRIEQKGEIHRGQFVALPGQGLPMRAGAGGHGRWLRAGSARVRRGVLFLLPGSDRFRRRSCNAASSQRTERLLQLRDLSQGGRWIELGELLLELVAADAGGSIAVGKDAVASSDAACDPGLAEPATARGSAIPPSAPRNSASASAPTLRVRPLRSASEAAISVAWPVALSNKVNAARRPEGACSNSASSCASAAFSPASSRRILTVSRRPAKICGVKIFSSACSLSPEPSVSKCPARLPLSTLET